jgi:hypothetical protein
MAWVIEQALKCADCGTKLEEWDPKRGGHRQAYAVKEFICPGCLQSEAVWEGIHREKSHKGKKLRLEPTQFHPDYIPKLERFGR